MTTDLAALALHEPYITFDNVIIGDGLGLLIANIGSFSLTSLLTPLLFSNVLHVLPMSKQIISISTLCVDNPINVIFLLQHYVQCKGAILEALYRISEGFWFSPSEHVMTSLLHFEEKVHRKDLA